MGNFDSFLNNGRSEFFRFSGDDYKDENFLISSNIAQAFNNLGICFRYYIRTYDTKYDVIFGEDNNSRYERYFDFMGMYVAPEENKFFSQFGIEHNDDVSVFVSKLHFRAASNNPTTKQEYIPMLGDLIEAKGSKFLYEIVSIPKVTDFSYYQSLNIVWEFSVKPYKNEHIDISDDIKNTTLNTFTDKDGHADIFDIRNIIDSKKEEILYTPKPLEGAQKNPFGNW
jgi:hypothetical protein